MLPEAHLGFRSMSTEAHLSMPPPPESVSGDRNRRPEIRGISARALLDYAGLLAVLAALVLLFSLTSRYFFTPLTFLTLANQIPALVVVSVGMTFVLIIAGIDLSVGSVLAFSGAMLGLALVSWELSLWLSVLLCVGAGLACGLVNGAITVRWAVPSFIVTLGMLEMARGGAYLVTGSQTMYIGAGIEAVGSPMGGLGLSPAFLLSVLIVVLAQVVLNRTVFGRYMIAVGTNEEAVRLSGINPRPVKVAVFAIAGLLAGLGGLFHVSYLQSADPNAGIGMELSAIAAVVIGGTSLMGGKGSVINTFFGVLIIAILQVGLAQMGATEPTKRVITGAVIVIAVILDAYRHRLAGRRFNLFEALGLRGRSI
jgi:ribose transport system permease protein